jgi:hypothetical protein
MRIERELLKQTLDWYEKDSSVGGLAALIECIEDELKKPDYQLSEDGLETLGDFLDLIKAADDKDVTNGLCQELVLRAYSAGKNNNISGR